MRSVGVAKNSDDDIVRLLEEFGISVEKPARTHGPRRPERRIRERRDLGFKARRNDDAQLNLDRRAVLSSYLASLPRARLLAWVDGLLLGNASEWQLALCIEQAVIDQHTLRTRHASKGRPRSHGVSPRMLNEWRELRRQFRQFSECRNPSMKVVGVPCRSQDPPEPAA